MGLGQSCVGDGLGHVFVIPQMLRLLLHGWIGTAVPCMVFSLVVPVQALKTHVATVSCHLLGSVLPPWLLSSFCTFQSLPPSPGLVLVPLSPFSIS